VRLLLPCAALLLAAACASKAKLVAQGGECLQATDCADGLVCVPQKDGSRICDNDLSGVQKTEDASPPPAKDGGPKDGATDGAVTDAPPPPADAPDDTGGGTDSATD
jgi:hypothetical protein